MTETEIVQLPTYVMNDIRNNAYKTGKDKVDFILEAIVEKFRQQKVEEINNQVRESETFN